MTQVNCFKLTKLTPRMQRLLVPIKKNDETFTIYFPFRGEFDPVSITIGWVVSYWSDHVNYHSVGVWTGYARVISESLESPKARWQFLVSRLIAHQDSSNTTSGHDIIFEHLGDEP